MSASPPYLLLHQNAGCKGRTSLPVAVGDQAAAHGRVSRPVLGRHGRWAKPLLLAGSHAASSPAAPRQAPKPLRPAASFSFADRTAHSPHAAAPGSITWHAHPTPLCPAASRRAAPLSAIPPPGRIEATYAGRGRRPGWRLHDGFHGGRAGGAALLWIGAPRVEDDREVGEVADGGVRIGRPARTTAATSHGTTQAAAWTGKVGVARGDAPSGRRGSVNGGRSTVAG